MKDHTRKSPRVSWALPAALVLLSMTLSACSPAYNWRNARHDAASGHMLMPCKPERAQRAVPLLGPAQEPVELWMLSCNAQGQTFAWSALRVPEGADWMAVEKAWRRAAWAALQIPLSAGEEPPDGWEMLTGGGQPAIRSHWSGPGVGHRGQTLQAHMLWLQTEDWMHLAALYGEVVEPEALRTFFDSFSPR